MHKRLFISVPLSHDFLDAFEQYSKKSSFPVRWIPKENLHMCLCFLGNIAQEKVESLFRALEHIQKPPPFKMSFKGISFAPPGKRARMIWATFSLEKEYTELVCSLKQTLKEYCQEDLDIREPFPHVTLARFKRPLPVTKDDLSPVHLDQKELIVSSYDVMESKLTPKGSIYTKVKTFYL